MHANLSHSSEMLDTTIMLHTFYLCIISAPFGYFKRYWKAWVIVINVFENQLQKNWLPKNKFISFTYQDSTESRVFWSF